MRSASGMGRFKVALATVLFAALAGCAPALADSPPETDTAPCAEYGKADAEMNAIYRQVLEMYKDEVEFLPSFRKAQRAWLAYRDAHLDSLYPGPATEYGSILPTCRCLTLTDLTRERTELLQKWIDGAQEGDACAGSIRIR